MPYFVGLDASKNTTHICVVDEHGQVADAGVVITTPKAIVGFLRGARRRYMLVGVEAMSLSAWLVEGMRKAGLLVIPIDPKHAHGVLKNQRNKTDRNDARGIAELMRVGAYRAVHLKSVESREVRALLVARQTLGEKAIDIENLIRGTLLGVGLKLGVMQRKSFDSQVRALALGHRFLLSLVEPLLEARRALIGQRDHLEDLLVATAKADPVCTRLMTAPGVGPITALTYRSAVDDPHRFVRSRAVGVHFGMTPKTLQSGDSDRRGTITCWGDGMVRRALVIAAWASFRRSRRKSWLAEWAAGVAKRRGGMRAVVAVARRLAVILHRMWVTETDFRWEVRA
jgi:transposase